MATFAADALFGDRGVRGLCAQPAEQEFVELGIELQGNGVRVGEVLDRKSDVERDHRAREVVGRHRRRAALLGVRGAYGLRRDPAVGTPESARDVTKSLVAARVGE